MPVAVLTFCLQTFCLYETIRYEVYLELLTFSEYNHSILK